MGLIVKNINMAGRLRGTFPQVPSPPPGPNIVTSGLIMNLDAGNSSSYSGSGTTWTDLSGNGNNGTLVNGPTYNSANSGSIVFDGNDDYGSVPSSQFQSGNNPFSYEVWFKFIGNGANPINIMFAYGLDIGPNLVPLIAVDSITNRVVFGFGSNSGDVYSSNIQINVWYQAIATYDKSFNKMYVNGSLQNTVSYSSANIQISGSSGPYAGIGCLFSTNGNIGRNRYGTFNGNIAIVRYYNRALNDTEIIQNFNATKSRYGL